LVARKVSTGAWRVFRKDYLIKDTGDISTTKEKALWIDKDINNEKGKEVLRDLFGEHLFDFPKSVYLVLKMAKIATASSEEHIVLDFFAGSCTTAHAVMQLNKEDGGNRRFICVQLPEPTKNKEYPTIAEIGKERIRRAIKKLSEPAAEGDLVAAPATADQARPGFNVFKLTASNFKPWTGVAEDDPDAYARQMELYLDPLVNQWQALDVIWEIAIKEGFGLTARVAPVENIKSNAVYHVHDADKNQSFHICLDARLAAATPRALALGKDDLFICRDIALDDELAANLALQCRLKTI
jgi:adenine-specific DNA-methyltransferase